MSLKEQCTFKPIGYYSAAMQITDNGKLYVDIHGLARSTTDNTPAIPHMVLSSTDASALLSHYETTGNKKTIPSIKLL